MYTEADRVCKARQGCACHPDHCSNVALHPAIGVSLPDESYQREGQEAWRGGRCEGEGQWGAFQPSPLEGAPAGILTGSLL